MRGLARGGALVETTLAIGVAMMILLGMLQFGVLGFREIAQDGAAFVAAHTYAQSPTSGTARATGAANAAFGAVAQTVIAVTPGSGTVTATISSTMQAASIPGAPVNVALRAGATERVPAAAVPTSGVFSTLGTLSNYRDASGAARATRPLLVAQLGLTAATTTCLNASSGGDGEGDDGGGDDGNNGNGNSPNGENSSHWNDEWSCRSGTYSGFVFPSTRPKTHVGPSSVWDASSSGSPLYAIYTWDNDATGSGGSGGNDGNGNNGGNGGD